MALTDWNSCIRNVCKALSRYDGYATYAQLENILSVPQSDLFGEHPSCYAAMLISELCENGIVKSEARVAAQAHLRHGMALGFLERVHSSGGHTSVAGMTRVDETARMALAPMGRALRAAQRAEYADFRQFLVTGALLDNDFDMYGLMLVTAMKNDHKAERADFARGLEACRKERAQWLAEQIPVRATREQIEGQTPRKALSDKSVQHHFNLRRQWAKSMGHLDEKDGLTDAGLDLAERLSAVCKENSMFWIAPSSECARKVGVMGEAGGIDSAWKLLRPQVPEGVPDAELVRRTSAFMQEAFAVMRLRVFAQAPLASVIPFVYFQEAQLGKKADLRQTFDAVLRGSRESIHCMLTATPEDCHYQLRSSSKAKKS